MATDELYEHDSGEPQERPSYLDRVANRYGLLEREDEDEPAEPTPRPGTPRPQERPATAARPAGEATKPEGEGSPMPPPRRQALERRERRQRIDRLEQQVSELLTQNKALLGALTGGKGASDIDPEKEPEKYTADLIKKGVLDALGGEEIVQFLQEQREERARWQEEEGQRKEHQERLAEWADNAESLERAYFDRAPDRQVPYQENLSIFAENVAFQAWQLADPRQPEAQRIALVKHEVALATINLYERIRKAGYDPVEYLDYMWTRTPPVRMFPVEEQQPNGNGGKPNGARQGKENRETAARAKAGAAAGSLSTAKAPPAPTAAGVVNSAAQDRPGSAAALVKAAKRTGLDPREALRQARREARG